jgi:hypothetical protein
MNTATFFKIFGGKAKTTVSTSLYLQSAGTGLILRTDGGSYTSGVFMYSDIAYAYTGSQVHRMFFKFDSTAIPTTAVLNSAQIVIRKTNSSYLRFYIYSDTHSDDLLPSSTMYAMPSNTVCGLSRDYVSEGVTNINLIEYDTVTTLDVSPLQSYISSGVPINLVAIGSSETVPYGQKFKDYNLIHLDLTYTI